MESASDSAGTAVPTQGNLVKIFFLSLTAALGGFLFGFDSGVINGTVDAIQGEFGSSDIGTGFNVASMLLGSAVGAFFAGNLADKIGRRWTMILTALAFGQCLGLRGRRIVPIFHRGASDGRACGWGGQHPVPGVYQ